MLLDSSSVLCSSQAPKLTRMLREKLVVGVELRSERGKKRYSPSPGSQLQGLRSLASVYLGSPI